MEMKASSLDVKRMDHLGLISAFCKEINLVELINQQIPKTSHRSKISNGTLLLAMILNGLGFVSRTLHLYPDFFSEKPTERLLGTGILPCHINDDVMGRFLDSLYETGVSDIYQKLALQVVQHLKLPCKSLNMDTTSFHLDGEYARDIDAHSIEIKRGYSRDHRPDLNQVILNLITENQAGIPLYMKACSGNANDVQTFKQMIKSHLKSMKAAYRNQYLIADAALYEKEIIQILDAEKQLFITRVPQKLSEAKTVIASGKQVEYKALKDGYFGAWFSSEYGGVKQRWLLIKSGQAKEREKHIINAHIKKSTNDSLVSFKKLCRQIFSCEVDAQKALNRWIEAQTFISVHEIQIVEKVKYIKRGRPNTEKEGEKNFSISGSLATDLSLCHEAEETTGLFILATNDLKEVLEMQFVLDEYKSQQAVEKGFRFLKSPDFLTSSLFLKKPERIEALLMVMTCSLMVYAAIEHLIRKKLQEENKFFPDMKKKPTQRPTARWVFFCFQGISLLIVDEKTELITNILDRHRVILDALGKNYWEFYS